MFIQSKICQFFRDFSSFSGHTTNAFEGFSICYKSVNSVTLYYINFTIFAFLLFKKKRFSCFLPNGFSNILNYFLKCEGGLLKNVSL